MQAYSREEEEKHRSDLHQIERRPEGQVLQSYLNCKLNRIAQKALSCSPENLKELQGKARMCEEIIRDLTREPIVDASGKER